MTRFHMVAAKKVEDAGTEERFARRMLEEARHGADQARRKGLPRHRWEADVRRWELQFENAARDRRYWEMDAIRQDTAAKKVAQAVKDRQEDLVKRTDEVHGLNLRFQRLRKLGRGLKASQSSLSSQSGSQEVTASFSITQRATAALKDVLDNLERGPRQYLRLTTEPDGRFILALDEQREGDTVVSHEGVFVLLVGSPLPPGLVGKTLDISPSHEGTQIVLSG